MVTINGSKIIIDDREVDLTPYQGMYVRVYLDNDGSVLINPQHDCYWQIAEVNLPPAKVIQQEKGIVQENVDEEVYITRGEGDTDEIPTLGTGQIVSAGFWWCNYQKDADWQQERNGIKWLGERRPQEGEQYPVTIRWTMDKIKHENIIEPLDLSKCNVIIFDLPGGGQ